MEGNQIQELTSCELTTNLTLIGLMRTGEWIMEKLSLKDPLVFGIIGKGNSKKVQKCDQD